MGARIDRELTLSELGRCTTELDRSMLRGVMAGALWTADRAHRRGLRQDGNCPYCSKGTREDEDHLLWWCAAWKSAREPFLPELMLLARALKLGALSDWPPCLHLCGPLSEQVVKRSGLARGPGWKKRCKELNRVSRHWVPGPDEDPDEASRQREELAVAGHQWAHDDQNPLEQFVHQLHCMFLAVMRARKQRDEEESLLFPVEQRKAPQEQYPWHQLQSPFPQPTKTCLPAMGQLPRDWKWGPDFQPAVLRWLSELQWLPREDSLPEAHRQVSFPELALDFESYTGRPLPPTPQTRFKGGETSLQEKGRVLRLAVSLLGKAAGRESILPAGFTNRCRSLVPLGAGTTAGVKGRPIFTRPAAVWHHLRRMQQYSAKRWAQQQQAKVARQQSKRRRAQGVKVKSAPTQQPQEVKCPGKGGAKRSAGAYASDFYAGPVLPPGTRRGPQYCVTEEPDPPAGAARCGRTALFTPPQKCAVARRPEQVPRLPRLWVCVAHQHRQCASCAAVGRGVAALLRQGTCRASATDNAGPTAGDTKSGGPPPWGGGHTVGEETQTTAGPGHGTGPGAGTQARKGGCDPPPCQEEALYAAGRCQARESRDRGDITPTPQRFWLR